jgi:hypothetical protein
LISCSFLGLSLVFFCGLVSMGLLFCGKPIVRGVFVVASFGRKYDIRFG